MPATEKAYKGLPMEGFIARWYTRNTSRDQRRFRRAAAAVEGRIARGAAVLEVAPGPGYLAIELARAGCRVTGLDISRSFVQIATENAARAGVQAEFRHGNASAMPFPEGSFDLVVCMAAFKNFTDPLGALNEFHRVLRPGGTASVFDLRRDAQLEAIAQEVEEMSLSRWNAAMTRFVFRHSLLRNAYRRSDMEALAAQSRFRSAEYREDGIGFELRLKREG